MTFAIKPTDSWSRFCEFLPVDGEELTNYERSYVCTAEKDLKAL